MAVATVSVAATSTGATALGMSWRTMSRPAPAPAARAASTNSCSLSESTWPRTMRATDIHELRPMMRVIVHIVGFRKAASARSRKMVGMDRSTSTSRMMTASRAPP